MLILFLLFYVAEQAVLIIGHTHWKAYYDNRKTFVNQDEVNNIDCFV